MIQVGLSSTCHLRGVISGFTGVGAKGSLSVVSWNIIDGLEGGLMVWAGISADKKQLYMWYAVAPML